ncbi:hypothetical protein HON49_02100 [archaeon]|jgi:hypothetical protein|nr:hypothetical protein [archaeon]
MERQELERILEERNVLNTIGVVRRQLQRPIPDHISINRKRDIVHSRANYVGSLGTWEDIYNRQKAKGNDYDSENFSELFIRNKGNYDSILDCIIGAVNKAGASV